jgi:hypothetical protein
MRTKTWTVIINTGKQADLASGLEKKEVQKPPQISTVEGPVGFGRRAILGFRLRRSGPPCKPPPSATLFRSVSCSRDRLHFEGLRDRLQ